MSSRFLFTCWPYPGHLNSQLGIADALRERGHEVAFYTGASAPTTVEGAGHPLFSFARLDEEQAYDSIRVLETRDQRERPRPGLIRRAFREWLADTIPQQVADLEPLIDEWRPDVVVTDLSLWAPIVVLWEKTGVPVALSSTFMGPLIPGPDAPPWGLGLAPPRTARARLVARGLTGLTDWLGRDLRERVEAIRAEHGLPPMGCSVNEFTRSLPLYLVGNVPELDYDRRDLPASVHYVGACVWHAAELPSTAAWLDTVPRQRPWVHVTEGTLHAGEPFVLRAAAHGLASAPVEAILTTGPQRDPATLGLGDLPVNVHLTQWVSHAELLPRCSAVVTTGGPATIMSALQAGVPLVVVPTTWDKPDNARRVVEAGVGVKLTPRRCTPDALRSAVQQVITEPGYQLAATRIAQRLAAERGPRRAAELLETLVTTSDVSGTQHPHGGGGQ